MFPHCKEGETMSLENAFVKAFGTTMMLDYQGLETWIHTDDHIIMEKVSILPLVVIGLA